MNMELSDAKQVVYRAVIPIEPTTKKNSLEIRYKMKDGKRVPFIGQGDAYKQYEQDAMWFLRPCTRGTIDYPVNVKCTFYRKDRHRIDLTNLLEAIDDILVSANILKDDTFTILVSHDGSRVLIDKDKPRTEIIITRCE